MAFRVPFPFIADLTSRAAGQLHRNFAEIEAAGPGVRVLPAGVLVADITASPGQMVFETDTLSWKGWNGTAWKTFTVT